MKNEKKRLKKQLDHFEKTYRAGIVKKEEYIKGKKKIEEKLKVVDKKIKEEEKKKKAVKDIINKPAKVDPKEADKKTIKKNSKKNLTPKKQKGEEDTRVIVMGKNGKNGKKEGSFWSYLILLVIIVMVLFFVYKYTQPVTPITKTVTIYEYSDFYCEYCAEMQVTLKDIKKDFGNKILIYHKQFPNEELHPLSKLAAEASECANDQNRFIEFHNALYFSDLPKETEQDLLDMAELMDFDDYDLFVECLTNHEKSEEVDKDITEGKANGVKFTPTLIINGEVLQGAQPYKVIKAEINKQLKS